MSQRFYYRAAAAATSASVAPAAAASHIGGSTRLSSRDGRPSVLQSVDVATRYRLFPDGRRGKRPSVSRRSRPSYTAATLSASLSTDQRRRTCSDIRVHRRNLYRCGRRSHFAGRSLRAAISLQAGSGRSPSNGRPRACEAAAVGRITLAGRSLKRNRPNRCPALALHPIVSCPPAHHSAPRNPAVPRYRRRSARQFDGRCFTAIDTGPAHAIVVAVSLYVGLLVCRNAAAAAAAADGQLRERIRRVVCVARRSTIQLERVHRAVCLEVTSLRKNDMNKPRSRSGLA